MRRNQNSYSAAVLLLAPLFLSAFVATAQAQDSGSFLDTRKDRQLGHILADGRGRTVYFSANDAACHSSCTGQCEKQWPPLLLGEQQSVLVEGIPGEFSTALRGGGGRQLCYNGRPLYTSQLDELAGDTRGHGLASNWYVANVQPTLQVMRGPDKRPYLAGPTGMTLYVLAVDKPGIGKCREGCAENWPPLIVAHEPAAPAGLRGTLGTRRRSPPDLRLQVTYEGRPLYYWSRDRVPGDTTGEGIGDIWSVARPASETQ